MTCGTPVVASNQSALPEVVGQAGLLVDPRDVKALAAAMSRLLADEDLHQKLAQAGRIRAAGFTWSHMAVKLTALYRQLIGQFTPDH
jgi:glycosyltransferase involved in cell wall biosynthesis